MNAPTNRSSLFSLPLLPLSFVSLQSYEGERKEGLRHGKGKQVFPDSSSYEGEWFEGKMHGQGTYRFASGAVYSGLSSFIFSFFAIITCPLFSFC